MGVEQLQAVGLVPPCSPDDSTATYDPSAVGRPLPDMSAWVQQVCSRGDRVLAEIEKAIAAAKRDGELKVKLRFEKLPILNCEIGVPWPK